MILCLNLFVLSLSDFYINQRSKIMDPIITNALMTFGAGFTFGALWMKWGY